MSLGDVKPAAMPTVGRVRWCVTHASCLQSLPRGDVDPERRASLTDGLDPALEAEQQVGVLVNSYTAALQELMMQLLVHWRVSAAACTLVGGCGCICHLPLSLAGQLLHSLCAQQACSPCGL